MKKFISEEIENMKYLLGYKRGVVISEQDTKTIAANISSGNYDNLDPKAAEAIKQAQSMLGGQSVLPNTTTGTNTPTAGTTPPAGTNTPTAGTTPPASTTPSTPIKIGVEYPSIKELQNSLNTKSQAGLTPDGKYGPKTSASILAALQKLPASTPTNTTPENAQVKDTDSEAIKKAAETNTPASSGTNQPTSGANQQVAGGAGANYSETGLEDLMA
jgi:hypothetical protein